MNGIRLASLTALLVLLTGCKLGGSVSGLDTDQTLVLRDDISGELLSVSGSGAFEFRQDYLANTPYDVRVATQPAGITHCRISAGEGISNGDQTDIAISCSDDLLACTMEYAPVCGKTWSSIQCITTPCPSGDEYRTYSNRCGLNVAQAELALTAACDDIEGFAPNAYEPVRVLANLPEGVRTEPATLTFNDTVLVVVPAAARCGTVDYSVIAQPTGTAQVKLTLVRALATPGEICQAATQPTLQFDLTPLESLNSGAGVTVEGVGVYGAESEADLTTQMRVLDAEVQTLIADKSCTADTDCDTLPYGAKACGGPARYLVYSTATLTAAEQQHLTETATEYSELSRQYNADNGVISTCDVVVPPTVGCVVGQCRAR